MQKKQSMAQNENPYAYTVLQNLKDAGCTDEMAEMFMALQTAGMGNSSAGFSPVTGSIAGEAPSQSKADRTAWTILSIRWRQRKRNNRRFSYESDSGSDLDADVPFTAATIFW